MKCSRCQHDNPAETRFCGQCAAALASLCAACGAANPPDNRFCGQCAAPLRPATVPSFPAPKAYTPRHLAERILTSKAALEGERKQVTVLFADLKGSMELLADRDPEEARKLLDPVLERMMEAVHHYEGTVNQVMGDGIMALFGAPIGHEDHAIRACYAAVRMQRRVNLYADEIQRTGGTPAQIRVGVNSGEVVVRAIGSDLHMDYTAVGQTTHLAARMEQMAKPGSTLVTGDTLKLAEGYVQVRPLGTVSVKGLETPAPVYELTGIVPARSRFQASAARGLTRFVGRDTEVQQLAQALERAAAGHGQAVAVVGEAGVGKSRLAWEFTRSHRTHGWLVLESGSVSYGKATPYLPAIDLLKAYCRIQERDDPRAIRERVAGKVLMLDRALEPLLTPLLALLDVPVDDATWDALDPPQRRQRTLEAVKWLLLRESQVQPLLLLFEDLHWIDAETQALLDGLIESLPTARVLLLVNYRPEYQHSWSHKTYYLQLRIDPLPPESAQELLNALLGEDRTLEPLGRVLIARTEGNPFFLEESVQTLVETQVLVGERGAYRLAKAPDAWQIPATAQAILAARIDRLPPDDKHLLQAASAIGKDVPFALLQAIADMSEASLRRGLTHLQGAEFLYETTLFPDLEYTFKHALTHEVTYASLLQERRRALHAQIVEAIERVYTDRLTEQIERLAHHAIRGAQWQKAFGYLREAGTKAVTRSAYREATAFWEEALRVVPHLPEARETLEHAIDIRFELRHAVVQIEGLSSLLHHLLEAERLANTLGDQRRLGWVYDYLSNYRYNVGDHEEAVEAATRALAIASDLGDFALTVAARFHLGNANYYRGRYQEAVELFQRNLQSLEQRPNAERLGLAVPPSILVRDWLVLSLAELGEFSEGVRLSEEALRIARETARELDLTYVLWAVGDLYLRQGDLERAAAALEDGLARCRAAFPGLLHNLAGPLGRVYALSGRVVDAIPLLMEALACATSGGVVGRHSRLTTYLAEGYLHAHRAAEAQEAALHALHLARTHQERGDEAWALNLLGEIAALADPPDVAMAEAHYGEAMALATELGMRPLDAHCHLGLGKLYRRLGNPEPAREHLDTAMMMYREMDMGFWLEKAGAEAGPPHGSSL